MSNTIYLYLKTHNKTGLKYLGKTEKDPFEYQGSGKRWKRHIAKHGYDVTTEILFETPCKEELKRVGLEYSEKWNIVESELFANLKPEEGDGGDPNHSVETRLKMSESRKRMLKEKVNPHVGMKRSDETKRKIGEKSKGRVVPSLLKTVKCPHCDKEGGYVTMQRWHFDRCRNKGE